MSYRCELHNTKLINGDCPDCIRQVFSTAIDTPAEADYSAAEGLSIAHMPPDKPPTVKEFQEGKQEESQDDTWREVIKIVEDGQFLSTKYKEITEQLKSNYHITRIKQ